jgi:glutamate racemase
MASDHRDFTWWQNPCCQTHLIPNERKAMPQTVVNKHSPIGIFDSGIGGLSVLRHIRQQLPHENLIYFADSGYAPYGDKPEETIVARTLAISAYLVQNGCKALVVACNTATAAAIHLLRERYPNIPIVGVEPGLKPAAAVTKTRSVGVLATDRTIGSDKFHALHNQLAAATGVRFITQACTGLADQIEKGELDSDATKALIRLFIAPLAESEVDTLVLGCTHYPFVLPLIEEAAKKVGIASASIIDTGEQVARQLARLLEQHNLVCDTGTNGTLEAFTTGEPKALSIAFEKLLLLHPPIKKIAV